MTVGLADHEYQDAHTRDVAVGRYSRAVRNLVEDSVILDMLAPLEMPYPGATIFDQRLSDAVSHDYRRTGIALYNSATGIQGHDSYGEALDYLARWQGFISRNPETFRLVETVADIEQAKSRGLSGIMFGVQNSDHIRTFEDIASFYRLGVRHGMLTYNYQNALGAGCRERIDGGVTDWGAQVIAEMNRLGMLVDASHAGPRTMMDVIELSSSPAAITHSNCRALSDHYRCVGDDAIKAMARRGGVMGITSVRRFVKSKGRPPRETYGEPADTVTLSDYVDHIDHVAQLVGVEHVGLGTDDSLYGADASPDYLTHWNITWKESVDGFVGPLRMYNLVEELMRRNYSPAHIRLILGGNFLRLLREVWGG